MTTPGSTLASRDGRWVEMWLGPDRLVNYLAATGGDRSRALALYEWNTDVASEALRRDLCHLEVGLRNAYDAALRNHWSGPTDWTSDPAGVFPPVWSTRGGKKTPHPKAKIDVNARPRKLLVQAREDAGGAAASPGKVVAELNLGFWRYLSVRRHEKSLWVPYLHHAFPAGTDRTCDVDDRIHRLHNVRNRIAHHEPLLKVNLAARLRDITDLAALIEPDLGTYITATTKIPKAIASRP